MPYVQGKQSSLEFILNIFPNNDSFVLTRFADTPLMTPEVLLQVTKFPLYL